MNLSKSFRWLLVAILLIGSAGWIISGELVYTRLAYLGGFLLASAGLWTIFSMRGVQLKRKTRTLRASMGDVFEEYYEIKKNAWPGSSWLEVINHSNLPNASGSKLMTRIGAHQLRYYNARTLLTKRGAFVLGPTTLTSGDPFGIFRIQKKQTTTDTLIILPMTFPILQFPPPPGLLPGGKAIRRRTVDVTPHAAEIREYVPGDPMKRIHWPSTAHRGQFMVKEFEQDPQSDIWLFLDAYGPVQASNPDPETSFQNENLWIRRPKITLPKDTFEYSVSIAASLATYFLTDRRAVGLVSAAGRLIVVPAERGDRQIHKIMETLAFLQSDGVMPLQGLVTIQAKLLPIGSGVILITPSGRPDILAAVEDLQRRNLKPSVILINAETFGGRENPENTVANLTSKNIPVSQINYGDDIGKQLASSSAFFHHPKSLQASFHPGR